MQKTPPPKVIDNHSTKLLNLVKQKLFYTLNLNPTSK